MITIVYVLPVGQIPSYLAHKPTPRQAEYFSLQISLRENLPETLSSNISKRQNDEQESVLSIIIKLRAKSAALNPYLYTTQLVDASSNRRREAQRNYSTIKLLTALCTVRYGTTRHKCLRQPVFEFSGIRKST